MFRSLCMVACVVLMTAIPGGRAEAQTAAEVDGVWRGDRSGVERTSPIRLTLRPGGDLEVHWVSAPPSVFPRTGPYEWRRDSNLWRLQGGVLIVTEPGFSDTFRRISAPTPGAATQTQPGTQAQVGPTATPGTAAGPTQEGGGSTPPAEKLERHYVTPGGARCIAYSGEVPTSYYRTATWTNVCEFEITIEVTKSNGYDDGQTTYPRTIRAARMNSAGELVVGEYGEALSGGARERILFWRELFEEE